MAGRTGSDAGDFDKLEEEFAYKHTHFNTVFPIKKIEMMKHRIEKGQTYGSPNLHSTFESEVFLKYSENSLNFSLYSNKDFFQFCAL